MKKEAMKGVERMRFCGMYMPAWQPRSGRNRAVEGGKIATKFTAGRPIYMRFGSVIALVGLLCLSCSGRLDLDNPSDPNSESYLNLQLFRMLLATPVVMFSTTATANGNIGGRAGGDNTCVAERLNRIFASGDSCTRVRAFLSVDSSDSIAALAANYGLPAGNAVIGPTGVPIAPNWNAVLTGNLTSSLSSAGAATAAFWTMANTDGTLNANNCALSMSNAGMGTMGSHTATGTAAISSGGSPCATMMPLVCVCY